jgi:hypothetical protein
LDQHHVAQVSSYLSYPKLHIQAIVYEAKAQLNAFGKE